MQRAKSIDNALRESQKNSTAKSQVKTHFSKFFDRDGKHVMQDVKKLSGGLTNHSYLVRTLSSVYVARIPGKDSNKMINREHESFDTQVAYAAGVTPEVVYDEKNGVKVTRYLQDATEMNIQQLRKPQYLLQVIDLLKKLHNSEQKFTNDADVFKRSQEWLQVLEEKKRVDAVEYQKILKLIELQETVDEDKFSKELDAIDKHQNHAERLVKLEKIKQVVDIIERLLANKNIEYKPCHIDAHPGNFLLYKNKMQAIDFEYAGNFDPLWDLAYLSMEGEFTSAQCDFALRAYFGEALNEEIRQRFYLYQLVVEYHVALWGLMQLAHDNAVSNPDELLRVTYRYINRGYEYLQSEVFSENLSKALMDNAMRNKHEDVQSCRPCSRK